MCALRPGTRERGSHAFGNDGSRNLEICSGRRKTPDVRNRRDPKVTAVSHREPY